VLSSLTADDGLAPEVLTLAHDPQTSGGLLAAVPPDRCAAVEVDLAAAGVEVWRVGRVEGGRGPGVELRA
jgi:selenide,water dikinase